ncbi:uncharacterized protein LOC141607966 [Silene latifolia]|uniref:uncharacterized protein LOC141607966 n=1 Tax=Silene latifolia TaxID=37657 RepID=UPI003D775C02
MDRSWMYGNRSSMDFRKGVEDFCRSAFNYAKRMGDDEFFCPCVDCSNVETVPSIRVLREHVVCRGFRQDYHIWIWHGEEGVYREDSSINDQMSGQHEEIEHHVDIEHHLEEEPNPNIDVSDEDTRVTIDDENVDDDDDRLNEMLNGLEDEMSNRPDVFESLMQASETPLYPGCIKYTKLYAVLTFFNIKAKHGWSDKSFTELLEALQDMFPEGNQIPKSNYYAKKLLCPLDLGYEKIDACPNDCLLYRNEYSHLHECPRCSKSRYKLADGIEFELGKKYPSAKVLWYLPIIPRLLRLFSIKSDAKHLRWHAEGRKKDGKLRHPADSPQWEIIDDKYPEFKNEVRNLRLGLSTDGMNPFGSLSSLHSTWPVLLVIYNLPPWLTMKRKYIMLSLLISGPKQPGNDIDIYLAPLIDDLKKLWYEGVTAFDAHASENFMLRAMLFCTINDYPAYGNLSGYKVKGKKACPICDDDMKSTYLTHSGKYVYLDNRRSLNRFHPYRKKKLPFNGKVEEEVARKPLSGKEVYERVIDIKTVFGKTVKIKESGCLWKKKSIFWELPYWQDLPVRHCLDVMHIEKNVCDALLGTLLNLPGKTKDGLKVRKDMEDMKIRSKLWPVQKDKSRKGKGSSFYLPPACYTLSKVEKKLFCECLYGIKVPTGFSSNIKRLVSRNDLKLIGMKSHDCHVMIQVFLPIAIRGILPKYVRCAITKLCSFFNTICNKVVDPETLDALQVDVIETLCQFEMYFPPSFFDIMVHLISHVVREIKLCGPVFLRWAYPFERHMGALQDMVRNPARPEASIVQGIVSEEVYEYCSEFVNKLQAIGLPRTRDDGRFEGKGLVGAKEISPPSNLRNKAHLYALQQSEAVQPYLERHKQDLASIYPSKGEMWLMKEHNRTFVEWFYNEVMKELSNTDNVVPDTIKWLAYGPRESVHSYEGFTINGYTFYTERQDKKSLSVQNSGVSMVASSREFANSKDKSPIDATLSYYGVIQEIWELDFCDFKVPFFRCKWIENSRRGVHIDEFGFTQVDMSRLRDNDEPFILASQARQVFYILDPSDHRWSLVVHGKRRILGVWDVLDENEYDEFQDIPPFANPINNVGDGTNLDTVYLRSDHGEGITVHNP